MANITRLEELAQHLEEGVLGHEVFDFSTINSSTKNKCGTAGCAIGELPVLYPNEWVWDRFGFVSLMQFETGSPSDDAAIWFDIDPGECIHLFYPDEQNIYAYGGKQLHVDATRQDVAANIRAFIKIKTA